MFDYFVKPGTILKEYLDEFNITQKELSKKICFSEKHISNIINGKAKISRKFAYELRKIFTEVKPEFWLSLENKYQLTIIEKNK